MLSVGETLKRARLEQGLDLSTVAALTKISARYLEAIESDDRKKFPSGFFYKSFVEQYARSLSLDTREMSAEVDRIVSADEPLPLPGFENVVARNVPPLRTPHRFRSRQSYASVLALVLVVAACSGIYAWWHGGRSFGSLEGSLEGVIGNLQAFAGPYAQGLGVVQSLAPSKAAPGTATASKVTTDRPAPAPAPAEAAASAAPNTSEQGAGQTAAVPVSLASETQPLEEPAAVSSTAPDSGHKTTSNYKTSEAEKTADEKSSDYKVLLDIMAREATWLSVSSDGKPVFAGTLQPNQTKTIEGKQSAKLRVGNAAGLQVRLNGKLLGPLGARGQVLTVLFTPDNFQIFAPPKESD
jgi:cytoskeletal protein RodZ